MPYQEPEFLPWDGRRVPLTLLGGYLGAGKTTVLNELLARTDRPIAVMVNDVGQINIDAALIKSRSTDTIELTDGCVCCSISGSFADAFDQLREREIPPEHVIVELSGVADPARVTPWGKTAGFRLDGVIVLADVDQFLERESDPTLGPLVRQQIAAADLIITTKVDLADPATVIDVRERLATLAPGLPIVDSPVATATAGLLELGAGREVDSTRLPAASLFDVHHVTAVPIPDPIGLEQLQTIVDGLDDQVIRAKAVARTTGGRLVVVQVVGRRRTITELPASENQDPTDLIVIEVNR